MILIAILYFVFSKTLSLADEVNYIYKVVDVIDGDTITINTENESKLINRLGLKIRLRGIDTPEKKGKCRKEKELAIEATKLLKSLVYGKSVILKDVKWDKFGGRINAKIFIDNVNIGQELLKNKLAVEYFGEKKSKDWCDMYN